MVTGPAILNEDSLIKHAGNEFHHFEGVDSLYCLPDDPLVDEVLIPGFQTAESVDCMVGFFSSEVLASLAPGLATYIACSQNSLRLIVSPLLRPDDKEAIENGLKSEEEIADEILEELIVTEDLLQRHTLKCLSWLIRQGRIEIKIAVMKDALFHPKVWLFKNNENTLAVHGSSNLTYSGITKNYEQISVSKSWEDPKQQFASDKLTAQFNKLWGNRVDSCAVLSISQALRERLVRTYHSDFPPTEEEFLNIKQRGTGVEEGYSDSYNLHHTQQVLPNRLVLPHGINIDSGPFVHQAKAIANWEAADRNGILAMATGSGKTITALAAAARLQDVCEALFIVISAPYRPLVSQWVDEVISFGVRPVPIKGNARERTNRLDLAIRSLVTGSKIQVAVVTENYLTSSDFRSLLNTIPGHVKTLLIADEVHNLGSYSFISSPLTRFDYRLGLSATPERQYDPEGTRALFDFFGEKVFEFSLSEAIGVCLVPYNYYLHRVALTEEEFEEWQRITSKLVRIGFGGEDQEPQESGKLSPEVQALLNKRRRVIEAAENKCLVLKNLLNKKAREEIRHTLIYATDKGRDQLRSINNMLQNDLNLTIHQLTAEETQSKRRASDLLEHFADGKYHAITCMRVLDEGVDIPQVSEAYLMASNTVKRQWIQRRGRVLRRCDKIDKQLAHLHDFIVVPPYLDDSGAKSILTAELNRAHEFAELSNNSGSKDGPYSEIEKLISEMYK